MRILDVFWVGVGGCVGSMFRYVVVFMCQGWGDVVGFPFGTLVVNWVGCFLMGCLQGVAMKGGVHKDLVMLLGAGVLGGFTTFSAFGWDWLKLMQAHRQWVSITYVLLTLVGGFALVAVGMALGTRFTSPR